MRGHGGVGEILAVKVIHGSPKWLIIGIIIIRSSFT